MSQSAIDRMLAEHNQSREEIKARREDWWAKLSHREKAKYLIDKVDPFHVYEADMPRLALAQVHATLALSEKPKT